MKFFFPQTKKETREKWFFPTFLLPKTAPVKITHQWPPYQNDIWGSERPFHLNSGERRKNQLGVKISLFLFKKVPKVGFFLKRTWGRKNKI